MNNYGDGPIIDAVSIYTHWIAPDEGIMHMTYYYSGEDPKNFHAPCTPEREAILAYAIEGLLAQGYLETELYGAKMYIRPGSPLVKLCEKAEAE